uniref:Uncharacterized protein n=1 Tax=Acrobeloides nanus TaxID=290746 RepID=A0A914DQX6_9BILA
MLVLKFRKKQFSSPFYKLFVVNGILGLSAKGLFGHLFNFTVITSGHPQFIGNINLFESQHFVVGLLGVHRSIVTSNKLEKATDLCSSNTQLVHTPGPMPDSVSVLAKNVPGMGTVAITGALFIQDDNLKRVDFPFVWNQDLLFDSRKRIICMSDWLIPGHSVPIPVTRQLKMNAGCSRHL